MKRIILALVAVAMLAGCGSGGTTSGSSAATDNSSAAKETGSITIQINNPVDEGKAAGKTVASLVPTGLQLEIRGPGGSFVHDYSLPLSGSITVPNLTVGTYGISAFEYTTQTDMQGYTGNVCVKMAYQGNITVSYNATSNVSLTLTAPTYGAPAYPAAYTIGQPFSVTYSFNGSNGGATPIFSNTVPTSAISLNWGSYSYTPSASDSVVYFQIISVNPSNGGVPIAFVYPNPANGEAQLSGPVQKAQGTISIGLTL
jgi:hypothetical protein